MPTIGTSTDAQIATPASTLRGTCRSANAPLLLQRALLLTLTVAFAHLSCGCAGLRTRIAHRSAECTQLCEEARQARELGHERRADQLLDAAVRQRPGDSQTRMDLADELWSSGRQIAAADVVAQLVADQPNDAPAALRLARMEFEIGRTAAAESALRLAMLNDPENPEALRLRAQMAETQGDWEAALATYHHLVQVLPDDLDARLAMASVYMRRDQPDRAAPMFRAVVQHPQATLAQRSSAEWQLGVSYAQSERWTDAVSCLESAIRTGQHDADDWYRLAYAQSQVGNYTASLVSIGETLQQEPTHTAALDLSRQMKRQDGQSITAVVPAGFVPQARTAAATDDSRRSAL